MIEQIIIYILFAVAGVSSTLYFLSNSKKSLLLYARYSYYALFTGIIAASFTLLFHIINHNMDFAYVFDFSSKEQPLYLLLSSFYAGQEGSFLLWALFIAIIGFSLIKYSSKRDYEPFVMGIFSLILLFFLFLLILKSPFSYIWDKYDDFKELLLRYPNGKGLNPVLENIWMAIHPPFLFAGYAAAAVPYAFSISGLIKKDYTNWHKVSYPWTLAASFLLGLGIILGGFWAYETLGWGGFWGWDPVENSSLLPWMTIITLIHTVIIQRKTGGLIKTNFVLAILSFVLVIYSTFLTRSGILSDNTSVHSFVDPGKFFFWIILIFLFVFLSLGIAFLVYRSKELIKHRIEFEATSREFIMSLGVLIFLASALIIFIGTSFPIFLDIANQPKVAVEVEFYNKWNLPLIIIVLLLITIAVYSNWKSTNTNEFLKRLAIPATSALAITIIALLFYELSLKNMLFMFSVSFASISSIILIIQKLIKNKPGFSGAYFSHGGIAILMLGVLFSGSFTETKSLSLVKDVPQSVMNYSLVYLGEEETGKEYQDKRKFNHKIEVSGTNFKGVITNTESYNIFNNFTEPAIEPGIKPLITEDIYITMKSTGYKFDNPSIVLSRNEYAFVPIDSSLKIRLYGYTMDGMMGSNKNISLGAVIGITKDSNEIIDTVYAQKDPKGFIPVWKKIIGTKLNIGFINFIQSKKEMADSKAAFCFYLDGAAQPKKLQVLTIDFSVKPLMTFVWLGSILCLLGFIIPLFKKKNEVRKNTNT